MGEKRLSSIRIVTCDDDISALNSVNENGSAILKRTNKHTQGIYCGPYAMREKTILLFSQYYLLEVKTQPLICFGKQEVYKYEMLAVYGAGFGNYLLVARLGD